MDWLGRYIDAAVKHLILRIGSLNPHLEMVSERLLASCSRSRRRNTVETGAASLMVRGTRAHAEALREGIAAVLATMGLRLSPDKTLITHIDEGLDVLGWRIQRHRKRGTSRYYVYVYPSTRAVLAVKRKLKRLRRTVEPNQPLDDLLRRVNSTLQGWAGYFRAGVSSATFSYLVASHRGPGVDRSGEDQHHPLPL